MTKLFSKPRKILAIAAHPDDLEYYIGGTLARLSQSGSEIIATVCSNGEKGGAGNNLGEIRKREQELAGKILGYKKVIFLEQPDQGLKANIHLNKKLVQLIEKVNPEVVFTFDCEKSLSFWEHSDHWAVGEATLEAIRSLRDKISTKYLYLFCSRTPDVLIDISKTVGLKIKAFCAHRSQNHFPGILKISSWYILKMTKRYRLATNYEFVESFRRIDLIYK
ncbi:MAG: hypothetical protein GTN40_03050 [Candidatus Aenigmarchaeota archaeon]|nr:hypothetical protein [Candidatus Aenigmarchaeota archaeon]